MINKTTHGGARRGAGRPTISTSGLVRVPVYLPPELIAVAGTLGHGNISAGVRAALASLAESANPPRELQVWRHKPSGSHYLIIWEGALVAAAGPMPPDQAQAMQSGAQPLPAVFDPALADWADDAWDRGEMEKVQP